MKLATSFWQWLGGLNARIALLVLCATGSALAHELQPGFLELREGATHDYQVMWKQPLSLGQPLRLTPVFPERCQLSAPPAQETLPQAWVYRAPIRCPGGLAGQVLAIEGLEAFSTDVLVRIAHADGRVETHLLKPEAPSLTLSEGAQRTQWTYFVLGLEHIALGIDHLLFVLGLLLIVRARWMLLKTITSFTLAHSLTLALATLMQISVAAAPLNAAIALSILFLAPEVVRVWRGETSLTIRHPWLVAFLFGLLHGLGFASGLAALGLPAGEIPAALLLFNLGVEAGQLAFVALVFALGWSWRVLQVRWSDALLRLPAYTLGALGAYWTIQRSLMIFGVKF